MTHTLNIAQAVHRGYTEAYDVQGSRSLVLYITLNVTMDSKGLAELVFRRSFIKFGACPTRASLSYRADGTQCKRAMQRCRLQSYIWPALCRSGFNAIHTSRVQSWRCCTVRPVGGQPNTPIAPTTNFRCKNRTKKSVSPGLQDRGQGRGAEYATDDHPDFWGGTPCLTCDRNTPPTSTNIVLAARLLP